MGMQYNELAASITNALLDYSKEVDEMLQEKIGETAREVRDNLANNPQIPKRTGKYKRSFFVRSLAKGRGYHRVVVANRQYQLTHLLEYSHPTGTGGRTRAFPHWEQAEKQAQKLYAKVLGAIGK